MEITGPVFDCNSTTVIADGTRLYGVWVNGKAPLNGGGGRYLGRVWRTDGYGWVASPPSLGGQDSWSAEVDRSIRYFRTRKDACLFLYGHAMGVGAAKLKEIMSSIPWG